MAIKRRAKPPKKSDKLRGVDESLFDEASTDDDAIDCSSIDLTDLLNTVIERGADEVLLRIATYDHDLEPVKFQAIVRFANRNRQWACVVGTDPATALVKALEQAVTLPNPEGSSNGKRTTPLHGTVKQSVSGRKGKPRRPLKKPVSKA